MKLNIINIKEVNYTQDFKPMMYLYLLYTVKPVLRGHLWDKEKVAFQER